MARREDPVHLYYNFILFLVFFCTVYTVAYEARSLGFAEATVKYRAEFFLRLDFKNIV